MSHQPQPPKSRFEIRVVHGDRYPLQIVEAETGAVVGSYYASSAVAAGRRLELLNAGKVVARLERDYDSNLSLAEAVARCREIGDATEGNGLHRLLWRLADLLESRGGPDA